MRLARKIFTPLVVAITRILLSLRYRIEVKGAAEVLEKCKERRSILLLPNHVAHTDPPILYAYLWPKFKMRPLASDRMGRLPIVRSLYALFNPIVVPDFGNSLNQFKIRKMQVGLENLVEGLKQGDNIVVYPSGKTKDQAREILGGASAAYEIIQKYPEVCVLLIRTSGLWGSSLSKAITGVSPNLFQRMREAFQNLFRNLIFFTPRRNITIELEFNPHDFPRKGSKIALNRYLEKWYNQYPDGKGNLLEDEPLTLVPYQFWSRKTIAITTNKRSNLKKGYEISAETRERIYAKIRNILNDPSLLIRDEMNLSTDLGMDSLNVAELIGYLIHNFELTEVFHGDLETVQTVLEVASGSVSVKEEAPQAPRFHWPEETDRPHPFMPLGKTFPEVFLNTCKSMNGFAALGDDHAGVLSYKQSKQSILVLAQYFKTFPEERIGVMLPSSVGAILVVLALHFAGKVPVMLNWTLGRRYLEQMVHLSETQRVITSWRFIERINHVDFGSLVDQAMFIEDIRLALSLPMKLKGALMTHCPNALILKVLHLDRLSEDHPATIVFSSGTESAPKGIPLTHKNLLAAIRSSLWNYRETTSNQDVVYGILPSFHSFGFTVGGFLPLLTGMKIALYPNPMDSLAIAEGVKRWNVTYLPMVPNLLRKLFLVANKDQLATVRFFITAGEKATADLFETVAKTYPKAQLTEGYGLTETSPTITIMRPNLPPKGVGQLLLDVQAITIHPETLIPLPAGTQGEICVKGPNVFHGYLGGFPNPFIQIGNDTWLRTGDIGYLEEDQTLILVGRIKRFVKLGGEMISLAAVEEALTQGCAKKDLVPKELPSLAICPVKREGGEIQLVFFSTFSVEREILNHILRDSGFSNLIKISAVRKVDEFPMIGTGKINYRNLEQLIYTGRD